MTTQRWFSLPDLNRAMPWVVLVLVGVVHGVALNDFLFHFPEDVLYFKGSDHYFYLKWAKEIAAGDWLAQKQGVFSFAPLYPYLLAVLFALTGHSDPLVGVVMNAAAGVGAALFVALIARRLFGAVAGLCAGLLFGLDGSMVALEGLLLNDCILPFLLLGGLWGAVTIEQRCGNGEVVSWRLFVGTGLLFGLAVLARASNIIPMGVVWLFLAWRLRSKGWFTRGLLPMAVAMGLVVSIPLMRNVLLFDAWKLTGNGPGILYVGNHRHATGLNEYYEQMDEDPKAKGFLENVWIKRLRADIEEDPSYLVGIFGRKARFFFTSWDSPDNWNYYFTRKQVPAIAFLTLGPLLLFAIGYAGLVVTWRERQRLLLIYLFALSFAGSIIVIMISGRYKLPFHGVLAILGAGGLALAWEAVRLRAWRIPATMGLLCVGLLPVVMPRHIEGILFQEIFPLRSSDYLNIASQYNKRGEYQRTIDLVEPLVLTAPLMNSPQSVLLYGQVFTTLAIAYMDSGRPLQAAVLMEQVLEQLRERPVGKERQVFLETRLVALSRFQSGPRLREALNALLEVAPNHPLEKLIPANRLGP